MKRFFILWVALPVRIVHGLLKLSGLILFVCSCSPAETPTVATLIPGAGVLYIPLSSTGSVSSMEVSYELERSTTSEVGWLGKMWCFHCGRRPLRLGSTSSWLNRAVGNPAIGQKDEAGDFLRAAAKRIVTPGLFRVECSTCYSEVMQSSIVWTTKHPDAIDTG